MGTQVSDGHCVLGFAAAHPLLLVWQQPGGVVWLQGLDGIGARIYGVAVVALAADLTRGTGRFNTLTGLFATALATGGIIGPLIMGVLIQQLGFRTMFYSFAGLAAAAAGIFTIFVPDTKPLTPSRVPDTSEYRSQGIRLQC